MSVPVETLRTHLRYTAWATSRLVGAAAALTPEELTRDFRSADRHVLGTLVHVYAADRVWLRRIEGEPPGPFLEPERDMHLSVLQHDWPALLDRWQAWAATLADANGVARYQDLQGRPHATPLWQIVLHVVNHATHHRGQAAAMIRAMGHTPPPLDLIRYYREAGG
ncbi:MAG: DinB family protein [Vicinamibacterales bacterium]